MMFLMRRDREKEGRKHFALISHHEQERILSCPLASWTFTLFESQMFKCVFLRLSFMVQLPFPLFPSVPSISQMGDSLFMGELRAFPFSK